MNRLAGERAGAFFKIDEGVIVVVVEELDGHAELARVVKIALVKVGNPPRTGVDV
jgi:hypothetical protein